MLKIKSSFNHFMMFLCWLSRSPSSPMRSRTAEEACCSKTVPSPLRLKLTSHKTEDNPQVRKRKLHFLSLVFETFNFSPPLRVEVFGSIGDVILLVFARLSAFLALWPIFPVSLQASPFSTDYSGKHLLVTTNGTAC